MASATQKINEIIDMLDKKIILLDKRKEINVSMRIDEVVPFLQDVLAVAKDDVSSRKFDITASVATGCTVAYTINGESASAGSNVLTYGDTLVITVTPSTGYNLTAVKVNGENYVSGTAITVTTDIALTVTTALKTFNLTITQGENTTVTVTKGGVEVEAGTGVISYGDVLTISATAGEGYTLSTLTVDGNDFVSGQTVTVSANVVIVSEATVVPVEPE